MTHFLQVFCMDFFGSLNTNYIAQPFGIVLCAIIMFYAENDFSEQFSFHKVSVLEITKEKVDHVI